MISGCRGCFCRGTGLFLSGQFFQCADSQGASAFARGTAEEICQSCHTHCDGQGHTDKLLHCGHTKRFAKKTPKINLLIKSYVIDNSGPFLSILSDIINVQYYAERRSNGVFVLYLGKGGRRVKINYFHFIYNWLQLIAESHVCMSTGWKLCWEMSSETWRLLGAGLCTKDNASSTITSQVTLSPQY